MWLLVVIHFLVGAYDHHVWQVQHDESLQEHHACVVCGDGGAWGWWCVGMVVRGDGDW